MQLKPKRILRCTTGVLALFLTTACDGGFGGRLDPVIASQLGPDYDALATGAERRIVIAGTVQDAVERHIIEDGKATGPFKVSQERPVVCAEPSPDAIEALAARVQASLSGSASRSDSAQAQAAAELSKEIATNSSSILKRSQGLALFRDGVFALCQARMNGLQNDGAYVDAFEQLLSASQSLIEKELMTEGWNKAVEVSINAPALPPAATPPASN